MSRSGRRRPSLGFVKRDKLDAPHLQPVSGSQAGHVDPLSVDEGAIRAFEIANLEITAARDGQAAVDAGHEGLLHDEVRLGRAAERTDAPGQDTERPLRLTAVDGAQRPHAKILAHRHTLPAFGEWGI